MWIIYSLAAAVIWGIDYVLVERLLGTARISTILAMEFLFGFLAMATVSLLSPVGKSEFANLFSVKQTAFTLVLVLILFTAGHLFIALGIVTKNATIAGLIEMSYPAFIALFSWILFHENTLNRGTVVGGLLIFAGLFVICVSSK
jgi:drug/metabolite transporter (DMT)-like permease